MKFKLLLLFALVLGALCGERIGLIGQCVREKDLAVTFDIAGSQRAEIVLELIHRLEAVVTVFMDPRVFTHEEYSEVCHKAEEYNCEVSEMPLNGYEGMDIDTLKSMVVSSHRRLNELTSTMDPKIYLNHPEMFDADAVQTMMALGMVMMSEKTSSLGLLKEMLINGHVNGMDQALEDLLHGWHGPTGQPMIMFDEVEDADLMTFVPFLVAGIKNKGYHFVTADQCLHGYECENDDCNDDGAPDWKEEYDEKLDTVVGQCVDDHSFALTFDGCVDDDVLALLDKHHIKATFFVHPHDLTTPSKQSAYRKMHDHGHTVGILSDDYEHMTMDQLWEEVPDDKEYLKKCTGRRPHYYMRPLSSPRLTYELIDMKMTCVGWGAETDFVDPQMLMGIKEAHLPGLLKPHMRAWTVGGRPMILGVTKCHPGMLRFLKVLIDFIKHDSEGYHFVNMDQCMLGRDEDSEYSSYETSSSEYVSDPNTYSEVTQDSENSDSDLDDSHPYIEGDEPVDWEESESYVGSTGVCNYQYLFNE
eukprot:TRINITY_DN2577_c0_g1_i5.p1 TRINITY_DN2577_c0_g1~~TRINITY_DN2577_c0_g1_i5.p1  ORF type:complete len:529 (+),score=176.03 TRINITY_DN2577_c0_g1_i5:288-1874(+)